MESIKTNTTSFVKIQNKCITQIVAKAEKGKFRIYVAWEWNDPASEAFFGFFKSTELFSEVNHENILHTANYGEDIGDTVEGQKIFMNLLID